MIQSNTIKLCHIKLKVVMTEFNINYPTVWKIEKCTNSGNTCAPHARLL